MSNEDKTKEQLTREIDQLRRMNDDFQPQAASHKKLIEKLQADISKCKHTKQDLHKSKEKYRSLVENVDFGITIIDTDFNVVMTNNTVGRWFSKSPSEFVGKKCFQVFEKKDRPCSPCPGAQAMASSKPCEIETEGVRDDGTRFIVKDRAFPSYGPNGEIVGFHEILEDITERKHAQERIENLAKFPSENPNPVLRIARDGKLLYANDTAESLVTEWDCQVGQTVPGNWQNIIADAFRKGTEQRAETEHDGKTFSFAIAPIIDANYANLYGRDITERKHAEDELQMERDKLELIFAAMNDGIYIVNKEYDIEYTNPVFVAEFGPYEGRKCYAYFHDRKESCPWCRNPEVFAGKTVHREWSSSKNGKTFDLVDTPLKNPDGSISKMGISRDITEHKKAEEALEIAKEHAEAANIAKNQFLANMSHEIRTPMSVITGFSDILITEELTKTQQTYAELIRNAAKSLLTIINDILDYSKIEAGKLDVAPADYSLKKILGDIDAIMRPLAVEKELPFEIICCEGLPAIIQTDEDRLHQCLINLVSNAIKFTDKGHVHLNVSMEDKDAKPFIRFDVEDTGIGIPPDMKKHIFESFAQVEKGSTRKYGGTGLGLPITSQLAGLLGGELTFISRKAKGSTFSLVIPAGVDVTSQTSLAKEKAVRKIIPVKKVRMYSGKALVAEDDEGCQVLTKRFLERLGLEVTTADDGEEAIEKAVKGSFDLIFMDVRMPKLNGFEAAKALHRKGITTPIIALTAHAMKGDKELCIQAGCNGYLPKPIDQSQLLQILDDHLSVKAV